MKVNPVCSIGERIKQGLSIADLKAVDLTERTGISKSRISKYINDVVEPKQDGLKAIAEALNVNQVWLLGYDVPHGSDEDFLITSEMTVVADCYKRLNDLGKKEATKRVKELTHIPMYSSKKMPELRAAHIDEDLLDDEQMKLIEQDFEDMDNW